MRYGVSCECFNSLWPSDTIWQHKSGSTLAQVMACCLTAPSHYLNQCWLIISKVQWHSSVDNFTTETSAIYHKDTLKNIHLKFHSNLPGANNTLKNIHLKFHSNLPGANELKKNKPCYKYDWPMYILNRQYCNLHRDILPWKFTRVWPWVLSLPISAPFLTAVHSCCRNSATSPNPKLAPWPAMGCTRWAASLGIEYSAVPL